MSTAMDATMSPTMNRTPSRASAASKVARLRVLAGVLASVFAGIAQLLFFASPAIAVAGKSAAARVGAPVPEHIELFVGETRALDLRPRRIALGNGNVVSVTTLRSRQVLLMAEAVGRTSLLIWLAEGKPHRVTVEVVPVDLEATQRAVQDLLRDVEGLSVRRLDHRLALEGSAVDSRAQERAATITALYPGVVINLVGKLGWESMIHFDVRIVEVRSSALRDLGLRWADDIDGPKAEVSTERRWPPRAQLGWAATLDSRIRLLEQRGEVHIVAEPMLSCRSGGSARFVSGGELPIPVTDGLGSTDVEYKEYGVILDVKPIADPSGVVLARIETEVSQVDESQRVLGVPGFLKRRTATDINLRPGETLVIAGLVYRTRATDRQQLPGLGSLPVAGALFRQRARRGQSSELAIFITPRIVQAVPVKESAADPTLELGERMRDRARELGGQAPEPKP